MAATKNKQNNVGLKVQKIAQLLKCGSINEAYCQLISYWSEEQFPLVGHKRVPKALFQSHPQELPHFIDQAMYWDQLSYLPGDNLVKVDRASMAVSLETRLPLLNHRIVDFAWRVPLSMKLRDGQSKWLLRQVLYQYVPKQMIERPKMGFSVPVASWLRGPLRPWAESLLSELDQNLFDKGVVEGVWEKHLSGQYDFSNRLWSLLVFLDWDRSRQVKARIQQG